LERHLLLVIILAFLMASLAAILTPYIPLYGEDIGLPISTIGYVVALYHLAQFLGRIPMGTFSDIIGYRKMISLGGLSLLLAAIFYIISSAYPPLLFLAQVLLGLSVCMEWVTLPAYVSRFGEGKIPILTFITGWAYTFSVPLGGFFKDKFGMDFLFYWAFFTAIVALFIIGLLWKEAPAQDETENNDLASHSIISIYKSSFKTLKDTRVLRASLYSFLMFMNFNIALSLFPLRLSGLGFSAAIIGLLQFSRAGASSSIRLLSPRIEGKIGRNKILKYGTLIAGFSLMLISLVNSFPALIIISLIWGLSSGFYAPVVYGMVTDGTTIKDRGRGMGIRGTMGTLGSFLGIIIFSNIAELVSVPTGMVLAGALTVVGVIILELVLKREYIKI